LVLRWRKDNGRNKSGWWSLLSNERDRFQPLPPALISGVWYIYIKCSNEKYNEDKELR